MQPVVDLDAMEALLAKATPGEWGVWKGTAWVHTQIIENTISTILCEKGGGEVCQCDGADQTERKAKRNAKAIAALHNAAPALIAELRQLRAYRSEVEANLPTVQALLDSGQAALEREAANRWRPIAEAPKDGRAVDLFAEGRRFTGCYWMGATRRWVDAGGRVSGPTHFRPLPDPPEGA